MTIDIAKIGPTAYPLAIQAQASFSATPELERSKGAIVGEAGASARRTYDRRKLTQVGDGEGVSRIVVIGRAGSRKTTTALALGKGLDIPVVHLDQLYWTSDLQPVPNDRFEALHAAAISDDRWILDGDHFLKTPGA